MQPKQVVILAGGKGMRLHEVTSEVPKPLAPIADCPIIWHVMRYYALYGAREFIVCVGANGQRIREYLSSVKDWDIQVSDLGPEATKSERIAAALPYIKNDLFMLSYSDDLADVDLRLLEYAALRSRATVTLTAVQPRSPFGLLELSEEGAVRGFVEKRQMQQWINGGYMVVHRRVEEVIGLGEFEQEVFAALIGLGSLYAYQHHGFWRAMNTYKDYVELNDMAARGDCPVVRPQRSTTDALGA